MATDKVQARVVEAAKVLGISEQVVTMLWEQMTILAKSAAPQEVWSAILKVRAYGFAWKTILDYRKFGFADLWAEPSRRLQDLSRELRHESWETYTALLSEWMDCSGDSNKSEFAKMPSYLSLRLKIGKYMGTIKPAIARLKPDVDMCASIVEAFGEEPACLPEWSDSFEQGASTEGWIDSLSPSMNRIDDWYSKMDAACSQLASQVKFYCEGNVCASVVALSKKEKEEARIRKEQEQQAKKEVPVSIGDQTVRLTIALTKLDNPPFHLKDIQGMASDGAAWYVLAKGLWKSQTGMQWDRVLLPEGVVDDDLNTLAYIHGNLIVGDEYKRLIYYSGDGRAFQSASLPEDARKVVMHDGKYWYAQGFALNEYSYSKKGFLFDSHETDFYHETKLFTAEQLAGPWKSVGPNFSLPTGISIPDGALYASSGCIFAVCESMDCYQKNTGRGDSDEKYIAYLTGKGAWQKGEFNKEDAGKLREYSSFGSFMQAFSKIIYADTTGIYTSADGHFWQRVEVKDYRLSSPSLPSYYRLGKYLFLHESDSHAFYVSADGLTFQELLLNDSVADVAANQDSFLMAAYPDGERNLCQLFIGKLVESSQQSS